MKKSALDLAIVFWWIISVAVALFFVSLLIRLIVYIPGIDEDRVGAFAIPLAYALFTGALQWLMLRTRIKTAGWWPLASLGGMGLGQWLVLRRSLTPAGWWIAINLLAGVLLGLLVGVGVQTPSWEVYAAPLCMGLLPGQGMAVLLSSSRGETARTNQNSEVAV
jgi:hypothetical protein